MTSFRLSVGDGGYLKVIVIQDGWNDKKTTDVGTGGGRGGEGGAQTTVLVSWAPPLRPPIASLQSRRLLCLVGQRNRRAFPATDPGES